MYKFLYNGNTVFMENITKTSIRLIKNFIKCGLIGWLLEVIWTGFLAFRRREKKLTCKTSIWMFPIYGFASFFAPLSRSIKKRNLILRGIIYTAFIFAIEFTTGLILKKHDSCPWDYSGKKYNFKGIIRLDYSPLWFISGLFFEKIILKKH